jgi:hypothetical protein
LRRIGRLQGTRRQRQDRYSEKYSPHPACINAFHRRFLSGFRNEKSIRRPRSLLAISARKVYAAILKPQNSSDELMLSARTQNPQFNAFGIRSRSYQMGEASVVDLHAIELLQIDALPPIC